MLAVCSMFFVPFESVLNFFGDINTECTSNIIRATSSAQHNEAL